MKKAISLFLVCVVLLLSMSGCSVKAQKDSLAARAGLTSSSQIETVTLYAGRHPDEWSVDEPFGPKIDPIDLTGTAEGNKYIEALFFDAAVETEGPEAVLGRGYPLNGFILYSFKEDDTLDYTQMTVSVYRDETPYTVDVSLEYTDDKLWEIMQEDDLSRDGYPRGPGLSSYLLPDTREVWSREYIDAIFAEQAK